MIVGINSAISSIQEVLKILEQKAPHAASIIEELSNQIQKIEEGNPFTKKQALKHVGSMTHPKWLGDIYLKDISYSDWSKALDNMNNKCARAFNQLEKL